jgi:serine protease
LSKRSFLSASLTLGVAITCLLSFAASAGANRILMHTLQATVRQQKAAQHSSSGQAVQPPAPPCPESGQLPAPFSNCGLPEFPATTLPVMGNMAYWGGHVQVRPRVYLVYFGWGEKGAFPAAKPCQAVTLAEPGVPQATLKCDPDGAGARMADFVSQLGGTQWAGEQTQYYQSASGGSQQSITNPTNQLAGIWVDDRNPTSAKISYTDMAKEAARAIKHFGVRDLADANFVIAQPENFSDPQALATGYCAFHDYTEPNLEGGIYNGIQAGIAYTNMPYILAINSGGSNLCGENAVNSGKAGVLDGESIVLGHEIEETVTDPGAEDVLGTGTSATPIGGWFDPLDANENGDKCAWVGEPLIVGAPGEPNVVPIPGAMGDITGNRGRSFAVQSLWSNDSAAGAGYCAGAGTDLPTG